MKCEEITQISQQQQHIEQILNHIFFLNPLFKKIFFLTLEILN